MASALESIEPRHRPRTGAGTTPRAVKTAVIASVVVAASRIAPLERPIPGLGMDIGEAVRRGVSFVQDPKGALGDLVGDALGDFARDLGIAGVLAGAWQALKQVPWLGKWLATAEQFLSNFLATCWLELTGGRADPWNPPDGNIRCLGDLPTVRGQVKWHEWAAWPTGAELAVEMQSLIADLLPRIYEYLDDAPPISWEEMTGHAEDAPSGPDDNWDLDEDWARTPTRHIPFAPYVRAWKISSTRMGIELSFLRAVSFWPCSSSRSELVYEHEGDGESVYLVVQIDPTSANYADARVIGCVVPLHGEKAALSWTKMNIDGDGRARFGVARGSHAIGVLEGQGTVAAKFPYCLQTDTFPTPGEDNVTRYVAGHVERDPHVLYAAYEAENGWGKGGVWDLDAVMDGYSGWSAALDTGALAKMLGLPAVAIDGQNAACRRSACPASATCPTAANTAGTPIPPVLVAYEGAISATRPPTTLSANQLDAEGNTLTDADGVPLTETRARADALLW